MDCRVLPQRAAGSRPKRVEALRREPDVRRDRRIAQKLGRTLGEFYALPEGEQEDQIAADDLERGACPSCGRDPDECGDEHKVWYPQRQVCYPTRERAAAEWLFDALHKGREYHDGKGNHVKERSRSHPYHYRDGVTIFVTPFDLNPDDDFLSGTPAPDDSNGGE